MIAFEPRTRAAVAVALALAACGGRLAVEPEDGGQDQADVDVGAPPSGSGSGHGRDADGSPGGGPSDGEVLDAGGCSRFATQVVAHAFGPGQSHNQDDGFPEALFGPPYAGNPRSVVSLGNGGYVVLTFGGTAIVDGPGPDFIVFENPLGSFKELATVAVSDDGEHWTSFPCTWRPGDLDYGSCAGVTPVRSSPLNGVDPTDPLVAGGDAFDLHDVGVARARYVRVTDRADLDGNDGVFDLDAVAIVNAECP